MLQHWPNFAANAANGSAKPTWQPDGPEHKWKQTGIHLLLNKTCRIQTNEPEKPSVVLWFGRNIPHNPFTLSTQSVPLPSISTSPVKTHRGSSLVENAQLYQLIFLSKTNYPSWVVWLTERALTPSRCCYWCDLVLAPRSALLLTTLLAYFPSTFIQHHEHYFYRTNPPLASAFAVAVSSS